MDMDNSVSSWLSELGIDDQFWNDESATMEFVDDELSAFNYLLGNLSPKETAPTNSPATTSLSVLSAMKAPAKPPRSSSSPMVLAFGSPSQPAANSSPNQDDTFKLSEYLTVSQGSVTLNSDTTTKCARKPEKSGRRVRPASQTYDHIIAERKRRELLSQRFAALSALVPGLKKMDKTSVLGDAINYLKHLQERVKMLEEEATTKSTESVVLVKRSHVRCEDSDVIAGSSDDQEQSLPEIEAKVCNKNILLRVHCEKKNGALVKLLSQVANLHLAVFSTSVAPFGSLALDVTITAAMEPEFDVTVPELIRRLRSALQDSTYKENNQGNDDELEN